MANETVKGIEQGRADFAYRCALKAVNKLNDKQKKEYKSYVKKIPMLIKTNGLGATFAFMMSKKGTYEFIGNQVVEWLNEDQKELLKGRKINNILKDFVKFVVECNSSEYRMLTMEILSFFSWLRRFAEGLIEGD